MRSLRSLHPLQSLWVTSGGKGAGRMARRREFDPRAAYQPLEYLWKQGARRARGARLGAESATPAHPTAITRLVGSRGRGAQGHRQKMQLLPSLTAIAVILSSRGR